MHMHHSASSKLFTNISKLEFFSDLKPASSCFSHDSLKYVSKCLSFVSQKVISPPDLNKYCLSFIHHLLQHLQSPHFSSERGKEMKKPC